MKKAWVSPQVHITRVPPQAEGVDLAALDDAELEKLMKPRVCYQASEGFVTREIAGELLAVPVGTQVQSLNGMITFSEGGAFLWKLLSKPRTRDDLIILFAKEYEQQIEHVVTDVDEFIDRGLKRGLVVECK